VYCAAVAIKDAVRLPVLHFRVRHPHFRFGDTGDILEPENCVRGSVRSNREWRERDADRLITSPQRLHSLLRTNPRRNQQRVLFLFCLAHMQFSFLVKKIFVRDENKIHFFIHFFLVGFETGF
jgi:hypothetical protein